MGDIRDNDPLYRMRHALAGVSLALLASVPLAAMVATVVADRIADSYGLRAGIYAVLVLYVLGGAVVLFVKVARHETRPLSVRRLGLWLASLWLWPLLLALRPRRRDAG